MNDSDKAIKTWERYIKVFHQGDIRLIQTYMRYMSPNVRLLISRATNDYHKKLVNHESKTEEIYSLEPKTLEFLNTFLLRQIMGAFQIKIVRAVVENKNLVEYHHNLEKLIKLVNTKHAAFDFVIIETGHLKGIDQVDGMLLITDNSIGMEYIRSNFPEKDKLTTYFSRK